MFLLAEDSAIKTRFSGLTVSDDKKSTRPVKVFFRYPEGETEKDYPFITIENIGLSHARELQHSEQYYYFNPNGDESFGLNYWPSEQTRADLVSGQDGLGYERTGSFVPVNLLYQVATYTRTALHDRQLTAKILSYVAPLRRGSIYIPEDDTARRFDLLGWSNSDLLDQESGYRKRIFRKVYTIQMTAEIPSSALLPVDRVTSVVGTLQDRNDALSIVPHTPISEGF